MDLLLTKFSIVTFLAHLVLTEPVNGNTGLKNSGLIPLGKSKDGKAFYVDRQTTRTWQESREYCRVADLRLAILESRAQVDFLMETRSQNAALEYWTAARERRGEPEGLYWEGTASTPDFDVPYSWKWWSESSPYQYVWCTYLDARDGSMQTDFCSRKIATLCEEDPRKKQAVPKMLKLLTNPLN